MSASGPSRAPTRGPADGTPSAGLRPKWRVPPVVVSVGLVFVVALGIVLRFVCTSPLWLDEALTVNIARLPLADIGGALRHDGHPPLYYYLLHMWMTVFGESDTAARALAAMSSVAALPLAWVAGRRLGGRGFAVMALVVLAMSPYAIAHATEARMYSMVIVLVFAGWLVVTDALERPTALRLVTVAVLSGLLLLSHYWSFWLLAATGVLLVWRAWRPTRSDGRRPALLVAAAVAAGGLAFVPWLPSFLYQAAHTGTPWASPVRPTSAVAQAMDDFAGGDYQEALLFAMILAILVVLGLFGRAVSEREISLDLRTNAQVRVPALVATLTLGVGLAAGYATGATFVSRYGAVFFPFFVLVVAAGLTRFTSTLWRIGAVGVVVFFGLIGAGVNLTQDRTEARVIAEAIERDAVPGDAVAACPDQLGPALGRELGDGLPLVVYPEGDDGAFVDWVDYAERNAAADPDTFARRLLDEAAGHRIWFVWSGSYKTFEGRCEAIVNALRAERPSGGIIVAENGDEYYEHASLETFDPAP